MTSLVCGKEIAPVALQAERFGFTGGGPQLQLILARAWIRAYARRRWSASRTRWQVARTNCRQRLRDIIIAAEAADGRYARQWLAAVIVWSVTANRAWRVWQRFCTIVVRTVWTATGRPAVPARPTALAGDSHALDSRKNYRSSNQAAENLQSSCSGG